VLCHDPADWLRQCRVQDSSAVALFTHKAIDDFAEIGVDRGPPGTVDGVFLCIHLIDVDATVACRTDIQADVGLNAIEEFSFSLSAVLLVL